jgi:hypothetical protein
MMTAVADNLSALVEQLACYRKLARLCELQRQYVQQNQMDEFLSVLGQRETILADITRLEELVAPLKRNWAEVSASMSDVDRASALDMLAETKALLMQITQADQDDVLLLQQRKLNVGKQIAATSTARVINNRYAASAYGSNNGSRLNVAK